MTCTGASAPYDAEAGEVHPEVPVGELGELGDVGRRLAHRVPHE